MVFSRLGGLIQFKICGMGWTTLLLSPSIIVIMKNKELACFKLPNEDNICNIVTVYIIYSYRGCITLVS